MKDEDYAQINQDFIYEAAVYVYENEQVEMDEKFEDEAHNLLEEVAHRYRYTVDEYLAELERLGADWETLMLQVEHRIEHLEEIEEEENTEEPF